MSTGYNSLALEERYFASALPPGVPTFVNRIEGEKH